jgi:fructose-1-phosphate kinase PfkB-like protein
MPNVPLAGCDDHTRQARLAALAAAGTEHDFAGCLASVLANVAAKLGSSDALTTGRSGSWGAALVQQLTKGTVGWGDACLGDYKQPLR